MWNHSAAEQAAAVRRGDISAAELIDQQLERISQVNPTVNAVTQLLADSARSEAADLDARRQRGEPLGRLAGVPFTVKESIDIAGVATTHGAATLRDHVARRDAPPVERLRAAGAIPIGHTNMPTLTLAGMHTRSELFGDTVNPWDPGRTPGGSSGGDGAAVATGMAAIGLGNDAGGSVRLPASFCGVTGLKPGYGRFPADHRVGADDPPLAAQLFVVDGPLARNVADLRLVLEVLAGPDPRDPRAIPVATYGPPTPEPVPVAVVADPGGTGVHPSVQAAIRRAADALADAGHDVHEVPDVPDLTETLAVYSGMVMTEFAQTWPMVRKLLGEGGDRYIEMGMAKSVPTDLTGYLTLTARLLSVKRAWAEFLDRFPLLLAPVFTEPPVPPGIESQDEAGHERVGNGLRLCAATSAIGLPAVAVPTGIDAGLPTGVQLISRPWREDLCLDAAQAVEARFAPVVPIDPVPAS